MDQPPIAKQLEEAMLLNSQQDTPESRFNVYQELLFSELFLAVLALPDIQDKQASTQQNLNIAIFSNSQGVKFAAVFTSSAAIRAWKADGGNYISMRGQDICKILEESPAELIVVNPGNPIFISLQKAQYCSLAKGIAPQFNQNISIVKSAIADKNIANMQIIFAIDAFLQEQKDRLQQFLLEFPNIAASALGIIIAPNNNAMQPAAQMRTIFLRMQVMPPNPEELQKFCLDLREQLKNKLVDFAQQSFEVGVMPDMNFWIAAHKNKIILFDNNPPQENIVDSTKNIAENSNT